MTVNFLICKFCKKEKPISDFRKSVNGFLGLRRECKKCEYKFNRERSIQKNEDKKDDKIISLIQELDKHGFSLGNINFKVDLLKAIMKKQQLTFRSKKESHVTDKL